MGTAIPGLASALAMALTLLWCTAMRAEDAPDLELGEYLSTECTTCHRPDAVNAGIPNIFGLPAVVFTQTMEQYRDGTRINKIMINVARSLADEEIASLAAYMELQKPQH